MKFRTYKLPKFKTDSDIKHKGYEVARTLIIQLKLCFLMFVLLCMGEHQSCLFYVKKIAVMKVLCAIFLLLSSCLWFGNPVPPYQLLN